MSLKNPAALDEAIDAGAVSERLPHLVETFDQLAALRASLDDKTWFGGDKVYGHGPIDLRRVASIPRAVYVTCESLQPGCFNDPEWLARFVQKHPEYLTTRKVPRW